MLPVRCAHYSHLIEGPSKRTQALHRYKNLLRLDDTLSLTMAGMTDYTGVPLADILARFHEWRSGLALAVAVLGNIRQRLVAFGDDPAARNDVELADCFIDLITRYGGEFDRLLAELPEWVQEKHVEAVRQRLRALFIRKRTPETVPWL